MNLDFHYDACRLCPRECGINRRERKGFCGCGIWPKAARAALHHWEEPCISGVKGSGTIFFTGCTLRCCFCQNHSISQEGFGKEITVSQLGEIFLNLQEQGAHNINLVTGTQFLPSIIEALDSTRHRLKIPIVYNCGGYEKPETIQALADYVDIWLPDLKYFDSSLSARYSKAPDYFEKASKAILQMITQTGRLEFEPCISTDTDGQKNTVSLLKKGTIIRHMVLPGAKKDSIRLLHWIKDMLPEGTYMVSILSQYTPFWNSSQFPEINRRITSYEYYQVIDKAVALGLTQGYMQEKSSAKEEYTPPFNLEGIP